MSEKTGNWSTGNRSTGHKSTGNWSTGNFSTGNFSTGNSSTGNFSTGNFSTGNFSTGNFSTSNYSVGHFSTVDYSPYGMFNKPCSKEEFENCELPDFLYFELTYWISEENMTEKEKEDNPTYKTTGGYLKVLDYKDAFKKSWDNADEEDRALLFKLPNFDAEVFKEISGIDVNEKYYTIEELERLTGIKNLKIKM